MSSPNANEATNGDANSTINPSSNSGKSKGNQSAPPSAPIAPSSAVQAELSNAEKKKLAKAEKAARRSQVKAAVVETQASNTQQEGAVVSESSGSGKDKKNSTRRGSTAKESEIKQSATAIDTKAQDKAIVTQEASTSQALPLRLNNEIKAENQEVEIFGHLYGHSRKDSVENAAKDVHPAILTLSSQFSSYTICGSHARCVAMLIALKSVVLSYTTPTGTSLPRHLSSQFLSPQLAHIKSARPFSTTQANAIRWLKNVIAKIDPSVPEEIAKEGICTAIDAFIRDRFTVASQVISDATASKIRDGDVVMTFAKSAVVQLALLKAARKGTKFRVIVVDSRPLYEGRNLARTLASSGIEITYCFTPGLSHCEDVTLCILGAHAMLANGRLYSRVGTALAAMMAKEFHAQVIVCAESIKFTERVAVDSIVVNELALEDELVAEDDSPCMLENEVKEYEVISSPLKGWRDKDNLLLLNIMYDVTPSDMIDLVVTEYGSVPPASAPIIQRMSSGV